MLFRILLVVWLLHFDVIGMPSAVRFSNPAGIILHAGSPVVREEPSMGTLIAEDTVEGPRAVELAALGVEIGVERGPQVARRELADGRGQSLDIVATSSGATARIVGLITS